MAPCVPQRPILPVTYKATHDFVLHCLSDHLFLLLLFLIYFLILFLAALSLRCCAQAFSSCGERGLLFVAVCQLLIAVASFAAECGL